MPTIRHNPVYTVIVAVVILALIAFILPCRMYIANVLTQDENTSLAQTLFGDTRKAVSSKLYMQADIYFHRGVPHSGKKAFKSDPFQIALEKVSPSKHTHLSGSNNIKEIMPWLDLAIRADPQNLDSYIDAAYWISREGKRYDLALNILNRAQQNIDFSFQVEFEKGRLLVHMGKLTAAMHAFSAAILFWDKTADPDDKEDILYKRRALQYRALLYENAGLTDAAITDLRNLLKLGYKSPKMEERLALLQQGKQTNPPARDLLAYMLHKEDKQSHKCAHEGHDHAEHEHGHEHEHHDSDD